MFTIINEINNFFSYLNVNLKFKNRIVTILASLPTLYLLRFVYGYYQNENYVRSALFALLFLFFAYFIVLNYLYYFKNKNVSWDLTRLIDRFVPEGVLLKEEAAGQAHVRPEAIRGKELPVQTTTRQDLDLLHLISKLVDTEKLPIHDLNKKEGYYIDQYCLLPYYHIEELNDNELLITAGTSYDDLKPLGKTVLDEVHPPFVPVGLFLTGGKFKQNGKIYKEPYQLHLMVEEKHPADWEETPEIGSRVKRHHRK